MPFDAAANMPGQRVRRKSARLNVGLPVPELQWPTNLFGDSVELPDLMAVRASPPKTTLGKHVVDADGRGVITADAYDLCLPAAAICQAMEASPGSSARQAWAE